MPIRLAFHPKPNPAARPRPSRISGAVRAALAATTAMLALAAAQAAPVADLTQVQPGPAALVGPVEILQSGDISFGNEDQVYGSDTAAPYDLTAVLLHSYDGDVVAGNAAGASITASIDVDSGYVVTRGLVSYGIDSLVSNAGDIEVLAEVDLGNSLAVGVASFAPYFSTVYNEADGSISATAASGQGVYYGPDANAFAVFVTGTSAYVVNEGQIAAQAQADGEFSIAAATGVRTEGYYGFATVVNYGEVSAYARTTSNADTKTYAFAYGIDNRAHYGYFTASTVNYGDVLASTAAYRGGAISYAVRTSGNYAYTANEAGASVSAISKVEYSGIADATAVKTDGLYYAHDVNHGDISAYASSHDLATYGYFTYGAASATGVRETANYLGGVVMENTGSISATAVTRDVAGFFFGGAAATGTYQYGKYYAGLDNSGDIEAQGYSELGIVSTYGVVSRGKYGAYTVVENHEGASIVAVSQAGSAAGDTYGGRAISHGINMFAGSFALVYNDGGISASAYVDPNDRTYSENPALAYAYGVAQRGSYGATLDNSGTIEAFAGADFGYASAYGAKVTGLYYAVAYNHGEIVAAADADDGDAWAVGLYVNAPGQSQYLGCGPEGCYYAVYGGLGATINDGSIIAHADAQHGVAHAYGAVAISRLDGSFDNSGEIVATADAGDGEADAIAVLVRSDYGAVTVTNGAGGVMQATAHGDTASATALQLLGAYGANLYNAGSIVAAGNGERLAISSLGGGGNVLIENQGLVAGSVLLGDGDDYFYNGADGVLRLEDATVDLGLAGSDGNRFENAGVVRVVGGSYIQMGGGFSLVPSANPYAFYNDGLIDFQDGDTDDLLTITGDFAGDGDINVDVSGLDGASDLLYVDGSVVHGTAATVNVELLDLSGSIESLVPVIQVSGDSRSGNFRLGDVAWDKANSFVNLDFDLVADLDAGNARPDEFSLGIEVSGLSDAGTLAASVAPSVLSLVNAQVGSWRQRMGLIEGFDKGKVALWTRVFQDEGGFSPHHAADFGSGGNFAWKQRNSGLEGGIDFALSEEFALGLLVSVAKADTHLRRPGKGSGNIDADTWGMYGTWISEQGYYIDASYRWSNLDVDLHSVAGAMATEADADIFNLEMGYAWTLAGGLKIEPQLQYTRSNVDGLDTLVTGNGMRFHNEGGDSSRGRLGVSLRKSFGEAEKGWAWTPWGSLGAVREFEGESGYAINDVLFGETTVEGTSALLEAGFTAQHRSWSIYGGISWQEGGAVDGFIGGQLGVRYGF